jgi:hypothetical protein
MNVNLSISDLDLGNGSVKNFFSVNVEDFLKSIACTQEDFATLKSLAMRLMGCPVILLTFFRAVVRFSSLVAPAWCINTSGTEPPRTFLARCTKWSGSFDIHVTNRELVK